MLYISIKTKKMFLIFVLFLTSNVFSEGSKILKSTDTSISTSTSVNTYYTNGATNKPNACARFGTCDANKDYSFKSCYCDEYCTYFRDCCMDADITNSSSKLPDKFQYLSCVRFVSPNASGKNSNQGFYMVSKCPRDSGITKELVNNCEDDLHDGIPVSDNEHLTYKNEYCALCHGIKKYSFWSLVFVKCSRNFNFESIAETNIERRFGALKEQGCRMLVLPHNPHATIEANLIFPRFCINDIMTNFTNNGQECQRFYNPVYIKPSTYVRNNMCLNDYNQISYQMTCVLPNHWYSYFMAPRHDAKPMTVLFQFKRNDKNNGDKTCQNGYRYTKEVCIDPQCNNTSSKVCMRESVNNFRLVFDLFMESDEIHINTFQRALMMFFLSLPSNHYQLELMRFRYNVSCCFTGSVPMVIRRRCHFSGSVPIVILKNITYEELIKLRSNILNMKYSYQEHIQNMTFKVHRITKQDNNNICTHNSTTSKVFIFMEYILKYKKIIHFESFYQHYSDVPKYSEVEVEVEAEFDENGIPSFVTVLGWNRSFPIPVISDVSTSPFINIQVIITYTTMGISSLALILVIFMFIFFKLYIKFADQICINIMFTMICTNLLFMSGVGFVDISDVCYIIAVSLHFLWLSAFTWISLFTIMFTVTLWKMEMNLAFNADKNWSKRTLYVTGYGVPAMVVTFCILLENIWSDFHMDYNGQNCCFPTGYPENIVFFTAPVIFSILVNGMLLIVASKLLKRHYENSYSQVITVYATTITKLCLFSGFFWIFGVFSQVFENDVLAFIFIIFCGSQGLIFAICFVTSTRIRRKYFELLNRVNSNRASLEHEVEMKFSRRSFSSFS